jgi:hypothetical protein
VFGGHRRPLRWSSAIGGILLLVCAIGCPPHQTCIAPRSPEEALARVNDNAGQIAQPLQYSGLVSFRFRDADNRERAFYAYDARLFYAGPNKLLFDVLALSGKVAEFGSDGQQYWVSIEPEIHKLWYGTWAALERGTPRRLPLPPGDLLDVLMVRPLPAALAGGLQPLLRTADWDARLKVDKDQRLLFVRLDADGQPAGWREIRLDPCPPYQPLEIIDRLPNGEVQMHAVLGKYERVGGGPLTPRHYVVRWPRDDAEMRLDVTRAVFRPDLPDDVFEFPEGWQGERENLDEPASSSATPLIDAESM